MRLPALIPLAALAAFAPPAAVAAAEGPPNVLFLAVDDLRPELGCYGVPIVKTPNIDALAGGGLLFERAYCQQAVCSPSRTSLLTGRRPDTTRIYNLQDHFRDTIPDVVTLPEHFKRNGYFCQSFGKIFHGGLDDPKSWSAPSISQGVPAAEVATPRAQARPKQPKAKAKSKAKAKASTAKGRPPWSAPDVPDDALGDGQVALAAIEVMREVKDKPFFLAVGFRKPHLSFDAPKRYYDLYRLDEMPLATNPNPPEDAFLPALSNWGELRNYEGMPREGPVTERQARELVRGYYAATSFTDAQIGRVLDELDRLGLREKTIVILWGDHGWQLGEHGMWCKHTNFETSTRSMLMVRAPGRGQPGSRTSALVEFVDIYPTLCDLAGLPLADGLEGTSLAPLLDDPGRPWKSTAFSQYPRTGMMGYAMRTDRYRYVEWLEDGRRDGPPEGVELYDHREDPGENVNIAHRPEHKALVAELSAQLHAGWEAARPPSSGAPATR